MQVVLNDWKNLCVKREENENQDCNRENGNQDCNRENENQDSRKENVTKDCKKKLEMKVP